MGEMDGLLDVRIRADASSYSRYAQQFLHTMTHVQALTFARERGISPSGFHVLLAALEDSPITPTRLSRITGATAAAVTGVCDTLVRDGWIERNNNPRDRRSWWVVPTEKAFVTFEVLMGNDPNGPEALNLRP